MVVKNLRGPVRSSRLSSDLENIFNVEMSETHAEAFDSHQYARDVGGAIGWACAKEILHIWRHRDCRGAGWSKGRLLADVRNGQ